MPRTIHPKQTLYNGPTSLCAASAPAPYLTPVQRDESATRAPAGLYGGAE